MNLVDRLLLSGQHFCLAATPIGPHRVLYAALVCGQSLPSGKEQRLFVDVGVAHLAVASGCHLGFLEIIFGFLPAGWCFSLLVLFGYFSGLRLPILRALIRRLIRPWLQARFALSLLQIEAILTAGLLLVVPHWLLSRAFLMSWIGGLGFCLPWQVSKWPHVERCFYAALLLLPFCWISPIGFFWNILLAPVFGLVLLPLSAMAMLCPPLLRISEGAWNLLLAFLRAGPQSQPLPLFFPADQLVWLPPLVHAVLLILEVRWRRAWAFFSFSQSLAPP